MKIHPFDQAPVSAADFVCRQSRIMAVVAVIFSMAFTGLGIFLAFGPPHIWIGYIFIVTGGVFGLFMFRRMIMTFSPANWLLRWDGQRMLIRLAPTYSNATENVCVLEMNRSEIEWVRHYQHTSITKSSDGTEHATSKYLDIKTHFSRLEELDDHLREAGKPIGGHNWKIAVDMPIVLISGGTIRLTWMNSTSVVTPRIRKTLAVLGRDLQVAEAKKIVGDTTRDEKDLKKMDDQILAMAQAGQTIQAIKLARKRYGFSLTDAKQFVDELRNPTPPAQNR